MWSEAVLGKGLIFDFFSDPRVHKAILVTVQCADSIITFSDSSTKDTLMSKRITQKILPQTDTHHSATIRMQVNVMSNVEFTTIAWGETLFKNTFETVWEIVQDVVSHQKHLVLFRKIAVLPVFTQIGDTEPLKYTDTRYGSRVLMGRRLLVTRSIYRNLMVDTEMEV